MQKTLLPAYWCGWKQMDGLNQRKIATRFFLDYWAYREEISAENVVLVKGHRLKVSWEIAHQRYPNRPGRSFWLWEDAAESPWSGILTRNNPRFTTDDTEQWSVSEFSRSQQRETLFPWSSTRTLGEVRKNWFKFQSTSYLLIADYYRRFLVIRNLPF